MNIEMLHVSDIDVATMLYTLGIPIDGIFSSGKLNRYKEPIMECYFRKTPEVASLIDKYYADELRVNPHDLFLNRKEILNRMKAAQRVL